MNAYYLLTDLRDNIGEASAKRWGDNDLLRKLNFSHRLRANELISVPGDWLVTSEDLTPSNSVVTLPSDCVKPVYLEHTSEEYPISLNQNIRDRRTTYVIGTTLYSGLLDAYLLGNTIVINSDSFSDQVTLWYQQRIPDLHAGTESSVAALTLGFDLGNEPRFVANYYKGSYVEVMDATTKAVEIRSEITGYIAAGVATITGTPVDTDLYGTVSELPEEAMSLVVLEATLLCLAKPGAALDTKYFEYFSSLRREAKKDWNAFISTRLSGSNRTRITEVE